MRILKVWGVEEHRGGILLPDLDEVRMALWSFFERKQLPSTRAEVDRNMRLIASQGFGSMDILNPVGGPVLRIKKIDNKKGLYFVRIRNHHFFDVGKEIELAKKIAKSLSIISYSVKVETDLENGKFVFDFKNILEHLRHALPNLNMVSGQLTTEAMLAYNHFSGKTIPFGIYRDGDIQVSLIFGEEMATRRFLDDCPFSEKEPCEKEPKDNWKLDYAKSIITGQFTPAAEETSPSFRVIVGMIKDKSCEDVLPLVYGEVLAKSIARDIAEAMKM